MEQSGVWEGRDEIHENKLEIASVLGPPKLPLQREEGVDLVMLKMHLCQNEEAEEGFVRSWSCCRSGRCPMQGR